MAWWAQMAGAEEEPATRRMRTGKRMARTLGRMDGRGESRLVWMVSRGVSRESRSDSGDLGRRGVIAMQSLNTVGLHRG